MALGLVSRGESELAGDELLRLAAGFPVGKRQGVLLLREGLADLEGAVGLADNDAVPGLRGADDADFVQSLAGLDAELLAELAGCVAEHSVLSFLRVVVHTPFSTN